MGSAMGTHSKDTSGQGTIHSSGSHPHPEPLSRLMALLRPEAPEIRIILVLSMISGVLYLATPLTVDAVVNNFAFGGEHPV